jgi:hypothetical protein
VFCRQANVIEVVAVAAAVPVDRLWISGGRHDQSAGETSQMPIACCLSVPNLIILPLLLSTSAANVVDRMPRALRLMSWSALFFGFGVSSQKRV